MEAKPTCFCEADGEEACEFGVFFGVAGPAEELVRLLPLRTPFGAMINVGSVKETLLRRSLIIPKPFFACQLLRLVLNDVNLKADSENSQAALLQ